MFLRLQTILLQPELHGHMDLVSHSLQILLSRVSVNPYFFYNGRHTCTVFVHFWCTHFQLESISEGGFSVWFQNTNYGFKHARSWSCHNIQSGLGGLLGYTNIELLTIGFQYFKEAHEEYTNFESCLTLYKLIFPVFPISDTGPRYGRCGLRVLGVLLVVHLRVWPGHPQSSFYRIAHREQNASWWLRLSHDKINILIADWETIEEELAYRARLFKRWIVPSTRPRLLKRRIDRRINHYPVDKY